MEATITVDELRKVAKELGIKNIKTYKKVELLKLVEIENEKIEEQKRIANEKQVKETSSRFPRGKASKEIYDEILKHRSFKKWTLYKLYKEGKYSYTNIRRVFKKYIEPYLAEIEAELIESK